MAIYVISDTHFMHDRDFLYEPRGFNDIETHDSTIINNWNETVNPGDEVYMLGDFFMGDDYKKMTEVINSLNGRIHIAIGNHDTDYKVKAYLKADNVIEANYSYRIKVGQRTVYLSHYPTLTSNYDDSIGKMVFNIHGHVHSPERFTEDCPYMFNAACDALGCRPILIGDTVLQIRENVRTHRIKSDTVLKESFHEGFSDRETKP